MTAKKRGRLSTWTLISLVVLPIRFVQGWIYWGGASRRLIYAPQKLDPSSASWMANKLQAAMPGAIFDVNHAISYLLQHFYLLYGSIILFSLFELVVGLCLIFGLFTRSAAFISAVLSVSLMVIFGWQGTTCMDEWTVAITTCAIGLTLTLTGSAYFSLDSYLMNRYPNLENRKWLTILMSREVSPKHIRRAALAFTMFTVFFMLGTYNYYRGAIYSRFHEGPVSAYTHHIALTDAVYRSGNISFTAYVDAGSPASPAHIMQVMLLDQNNKVLRVWQAADLVDFPKSNIRNIYEYNLIKPAKFGLDAFVGAKATITLPQRIVLEKGRYMVAIETINNQYVETGFHV